MSKNKDNAIKQTNGNNAKNYTKAILKECEFVKMLEKDKDLSKNQIERATYDFKIKTKQHDDVYIIITSSHSLRDDRLDAINSKMSRVKRRYDEKKKQCICIVTSNCDNERNVGDDSKLLNAYNFGEREEVGIDMLVKTDDLLEVLQAMSQAERKNDVKNMIKDGKELIKKKNY